MKKLLSRKGKLLIIKMPVEKSGYLLKQLPVALELPTIEKNPHKLPSLSHWLTAGGIERSDEDSACTRNTAIDKTTMDRKDTNSPSSLLQL